MRLLSYFSAPFFTLAIWWSPLVIPASQAQEPAKITVKGLDQSQSYTVAELGALPHNTVNITEKDGAPVACEGVALVELLQRVGAPLGQALKGEALRLGVVVKASDGYEALFSLAELDPATGGRKAFLVYQANGKPLTPPVGPLRVIVPADQRHARWVRMVKEIEVMKISSQELKKE